MNFLKHFRINVLWITVLSLFYSSHLLGVEIKQIVIWGHKLHSHTHSYIHYGFYKAFKHLGYRTLWLDNSDDISNIDFQDTLFLTEHQVDEQIPLREDCYYLVHNSLDPKYDPIKEAGRYIYLQVYKTVYLTSPTLEEVEPYIFYDIPQATLIFPWATDLLPEEIEENKKKTPLLRLPRHLKINTIYWVGSIGGGIWGNQDQIDPFIQACKDKGIKFIWSNPWSRPISFKKNREYIQNSYVAPTICGSIQLKEGYIPCRIFKNISYGHLGATNSKVVYDLFQQKIVYNPDTYQLLEDIEKKFKKKNLSEQSLYRTKI